MSFFSSRLSQSSKQDILELSWKLELTHTGGKIAKSPAAQHTCVQMLVVIVPQRQPAVVVFVFLRRACVDQVQS